MSDDTTPPSVPSINDLPDEECPITELNRRQCAHCREKAGIPSQNADTINGLSVSMIGESPGRKATHPPQIYIQPDEAFLRGEFGNGRHRY